jgi:threonine/homoserine/homoserine lactone efflux protein
MDLALRALAAGLLAGLAIAVPLGAIGVLIVQEGLSHGWRAASAAATGVALVDVGYAAIATAAGAAVTRVLAGHTRDVQIAGAVVLLAVAARGFWALRLTPGAGGGSRGVGPVAEAGAGVTPAVRPGRILRRFVALTAVNPMTAVYFVVLAAGLGATVAGWRAGTAFVAGVFAGSLVWQLVLAAAGSLAGARLPGWARTVTGLVGYLLVTGYAVRLAVG